MLILVTGQHPQYLWHEYRASSIIYWLTRAKKKEEQIQQQNNDARVSRAQLRQEQSEDTRIRTTTITPFHSQQTHNKRPTLPTGTQYSIFIYGSFLRLAFQYEPDVEYYDHSKVVIGAMDKECPHCHAL
ncbi:ATP-dependent DNA helicase [Aphis craccivora]|uniref:ATP-dependent DNA helicase n=1 Tax=Aphis craccivora TaxID=307492 RepID=A0A6G0YH81_APHCR|nr:ATP-dependent DNA helicase [Aphis craccivora]